MDGSLETPRINHFTAIRPLTREQIERVKCLKPGQKIVEMLPYFDLERGWLYLLRVTPVKPVPRT